MKIQRLKKLLSYYKPYKKELFLDLFCSIIHSVLVTTIPILVKYMTTDVINFEKAQAYQTLSLMSLLILGLFIIIFLCSRYTKYQGNMLSVKVESDIKVELFKHFQNQDFNFFDESKVGKLMSYITTDAYNLTTFIKEVPETLLDVFIRLIGAGIVLFIANPMFGTITFGILTLILCVAIYYIPKMQKEIEKSRKIYSELTSELEESISGIKTVQSFTNEDKQISKFNDNMKIYFSTSDKVNKLHGTVTGIIDPILIGLIPIVTIISIFFILDNKFSINDLIVFMLYADILIVPIFNIFSILSELNEGMVGINRVFDILEVQPEIVDLPNSINLQKINGNIKFKNVYFRYKSSDKQVLKNLSFEIKAGEYIALVGLSGVGKSTLCHLIPRFYDVTDGEICIDDIPIKNIKLKSLRQNVGFVQQDIFLFSGSVIENIRYGNLNAAETEVVEAAKKAYAHEFICKLENGYNTYIGERGTKLSGGQKQRIAIARAFLKNPPILIFDEATSSLDNESERLIQKSMENLAQNRTTIVIAHRLSTIKNAKRILVLDESGIAEEGTHEELLNKNGIYAGLYNLQFKKIGVEYEKYF